MKQKDIFNFKSTNSHSLSTFTSCVSKRGGIKNLEAVVRRCSVKKLFLEISQNSQENTCVRVSFLIKLQATPATLLKKRLWQRCFPVNFAKFLRTPFLKEHLWWLLLKTDDVVNEPGTFEMRKYASFAEMIMILLMIITKAQPLSFDS